MQYISDDNQFLNSNKFYISFIISNLIGWEKSESLGFVNRLGIGCLIRWIFSDYSGILQAFRPEFRSEKQTNLADGYSSHNSAIIVVWFSDRNSSRNSRRILLSSYKFWAFVWMVSTSLVGILQMTTEFFSNPNSDQNSVGILIGKADDFS